MTAAAKESRLPFVQSIVKPPTEDLDHLGKAWGPVKAKTMNELLTREGRTGTKRSLPRIAQDAGVSQDFLRSLRGYDVRIDKNRFEYRNRERTGVVKVLEALGTSESAFLTMAVLRA